MYTYIDACFTYIWIQRYRDVQLLLGLNVYFMPGVIYDIIGRRVVGSWFLSALQI